MVKNCSHLVGLASLVKGVSGIRCSQALIFVNPVWTGEYISSFNLHSSDSLRSSASFITPQVFALPPPLRRRSSSSLCSYVVAALLHIHSRLSSSSCTLSNRGCWHWDWIGYCLGLSLLRLISLASLRYAPSIPRS